MNYKTIAAALALACAGSAYAVPRNVAFFDVNKINVQSFASQAGNSPDIYLQFDQSDAYRRLMQAISSNYSPPSYGGGGTTTTNNITAAVPEPETYAMMVAGLLIVGSVARRRRDQR